MENKNKQEESLMKFDYYIHEDKYLDGYTDYFCVDIDTINFYGPTCIDSIYANATSYEEAKAEVIASLKVLRDEIDRLIEREENFDTSSLPTILDKRYYG